jgi:2-oxoglutarate ferredoxin oxidoreductase subunit delta
LAEVKIFNELCKGVEECGICVFICPRHLFHPAPILNQKGYRPPQIANPEECPGCENCMIYCPDMAIAVAKEKDRRKKKA